MKNHKQITELVKSISGQANILTIPRVYLDLLKGDHIAALFLSQAVYWSDRSGRTDGKFYKSYTDWKDETGLTQYQVNRAIDKINKVMPSLVERTVKRAHGAPTVHYFIDVPLLSSSIIKFLDNRETSQSDYQVSSQSDYQVSSQSLTETTTETTSKINRVKEPVEFPAILDYKEFRETWNEWEKYRRVEKRSKLTPTSIKRQLMLLERHPDKAIAMLDQSMRNGWKGVFELKTRTNGRKQAGASFADVLAEAAKE